MLAAFSKEKKAIFYLQIMLCFFLIVWHRLKNQSTPKEGLTVLINEDKELAELRSGHWSRAGKCYARYVTRWHWRTPRWKRKVPSRFSRVDSVILWWSNLKRGSMSATLSRTVLVYAQFSGILKNNTPSFSNDLGWMAIMLLSYPKKHEQNQMFSSVLAHI